MRRAFPDAEDLMLALCDQLADTYREALMQGVASGEGRGRLDLFFGLNSDLLEVTSTWPGALWIA